VLKITLRKSLYHKKFSSNENNITDAALTVSDDTLGKRLRNDRRGLLSGTAGISDDLRVTGGGTAGSGTSSNVLHYIIHTLY